MTFDGTRLCIAVIVLALAAPILAHAGGAIFDTDIGGPPDDGPSYFGFVRDAGGSSVADAKVTVSPREGGALVTRTNIMGVYKFPGLGKEINPDNVTISCAKDGYKEANVLRRPRAGDDKDPIEIECYLQKE